MGNLDDRKQIEAALSGFIELDRLAEDTAKIYVEKKLTENSGDLANIVSLNIDNVYEIAKSLSSIVVDMPSYQTILDIVRKWDNFLYRYNFSSPLIEIEDFCGEVVKKRRKPVRMVYGEVVKKSSDKTVKVKTESLKRHPRYNKVIRKTKNYLVHDEFNEAREGDFVFASEGRPISKRKRHKLIAIRPRR